MTSDRERAFDHVRRGWTPGEEGVGLLLREPDRPPRLVLWTRSSAEAPSRADVERLLDIEGAHIAAWLKLYAHGAFTLMPGPAGMGANEAPLREMVARLDQRLRPASRWDFER